jgi:starvation-inducible DNA-binding protein
MMATLTHNRAGRTFKTSVNLPEDKRAEIIEVLNARLADTIDLKTQTKFAHWNVKGKDFFQLHELFDQIATNLDAAADLLGERVTQLGGKALGTSRQVAVTSEIKEYDLEAVGGEEHVKALSARLARLTNAAREAIDRTGDLGDQGTADLFTEIVRQADKDLWFLEAHLQG